MIQRIQSFYLVLVAVGVVLMFQFPIATYTLQQFSPDNELTATLQLLPQQSRYATPDSNDPANLVFVGSDIVSLKGVWLLDIFAAAIGIIALVSLFMYKNRMRQIRVVACGFLANVIYIFLIFFWAINGTGGNSGYWHTLQVSGFQPQDVSMLSVGTITPLVTVLLLFLAQRAIRKDEIKVRAADRLR